MLRLVTLAAAAATLAVPAFAAETIHIHTAGKSPDQVRAEVHQAAVYLCREQARGSVLEFFGQQGCVTKTERATLARGGFDNTTVASR